MTCSSPDDVCYFQSDDCRGAWGGRDQIRLSPGDLGFRQGVTAVERMRTYQGRVFCADRHLDRWHRTTSVLRIPAVSAQRVRDLLRELCQRNRSYIADQVDVGITLFATPGTGDAESGQARSGQASARGKRPTLGLHLNQIDHAKVKRRQQSGQPLLVTNTRQPSDQCWPREVKVRCRLHYYLADQAARQVQRAATGLLLDQDGTVTETSIANIAIVESGRIISPHTHQVLPGVTQSVASELAREASIAWTNQSITPDRLRAADEILLMGTDTGIWFANQIDQVPVGDGQRGPVCEQLQTLFFQRSGAGG